MQRRKLIPIGLVVIAAFGLFAFCEAIARSSGRSISVGSENVEARADRQMCTAIGVGSKATEDGSTITTHNADCVDCDFRITHVPARDWPAGSSRPIYFNRQTYPRYVQDGSEGNNLGPDYLKSESYPDSTIYPWNVSKPMSYIEQVAHTYAYTMGSYGIQNEKQLSIGESTCASVFSAVSISQGGTAAMDMTTLTQIAMERCETARCAIKVMGDTATSYGYYSPEGIQDSSGEALVISDTSETWMFHILPDDTGSSAIWVAQKVPAGHITAVANQFVIGEVDLTDKLNYLGSSNLLTVAATNGFWDPDGGVAFHFAQVYGLDIGPQSMMCTRRVWRVFTLAAPSLLPQFSPFTDSWGTFGFGEDGSKPYPFSVKPDNLLSLTDIIAMNRDQYEGTLFDMTQATAAGPFGDPIRYRSVSMETDPVNGVTPEELTQSLMYERPIALWRTAYSTVTQSRSWLPNVIGAVTWIAQYNPRHSTFIPIYANAESIPTSMSTGNLYKFDMSVNFWIHSLCSNYLSKWYLHAIGDIHTHQLALEEAIFGTYAAIEQQAAAMLQRRQIDTDTSTPDADIGRVTDKPDRRIRYGDDDNNTHTLPPILIPPLPPGADPNGPHPGYTDADPTGTGTGEDAEVHVGSNRHGNWDAGQYPYKEEEGGDGRHSDPDSGITDPYQQEDSSSHDRKDGHEDGDKNSDKSGDKNGDKSDDNKNGDNNGSDNGNTNKGRHSDPDSGISIDDTATGPQEANSPHGRDESGHEHDVDDRYMKDASPEEGAVDTDPDSAAPNSEIFINPHTSRPSHAPTHRPTASRTRKPTVIQTTSSTAADTPADTTASTAESAISFVNINGEQINMTIIGDGEAAVMQLLTAFSNDTAKVVRDKWWEFFFYEISRFRDIYKIVEPHAETFTQAFEYTGVPRWWLEQIGYWGAPGTPAPDRTAPMPIRPVAYPTLENKEDYAQANQTYQWFAPSYTIELEDENSDLSTHVRSLSIRVGLAGFFGTLFGMLLMYCLMRNDPRRAGYQRISD